MKWMGGGVRACRGEGHKKSRAHPLYECTCGPGTRTLLLREVSERLPLAPHSPVPLQSQVRQQATARALRMQ